jgi:hypothetical protein
MNKKVLVLTGGTDEFKSKECTDLFIKDVLKLTNPSKERYAKKHGYDFINLTSLGSDLRGVASNKELGVQRLFRVFDYLILYDVVMWIDADALITNDDYDILKIGLDENHLFYASNVWNGHHLNDVPYFSTGNFMIQKTKNIQEFIEYFYHVYSNLNKSFREEQHTLNLLHKFTDIGNKFKIVSNDIFDSIPSQEMYQPYWKPGLPIIHQWKHGNFLVHLTGVSNMGRVEILNNYFKEYL